MADRTVTVTFDDGSSHVYQGVPDSVTPEQATARAAKDFPGKNVRHLDGGRGGGKETPGALRRGIEGFMEGARETAEAVTNLPGTISKAAKRGAELVSEDVHDPIKFAREHALEPAKMALRSAKGTLEEAGRTVTHPVETAKETFKPENIGRAAEKGLELAALGQVGRAAKEFAAGAGMLTDEAAAARRAKVIEAATSESTKIHKLAAEDAKLPPSDEFPTTPANQDLESTVRREAKTKLREVLERRKAETDPKWDAYRKRGEELESGGEHFTTSRAGADLLEHLSTVIQGGVENETAYTDEEIKSAARLRRALSGTDKTQPGRFPVKLDVIDKELRNLRALQNGAGEEGYNAVVRERYKTLADNLESALREWVGPENYPRAHYKAMSEEANRWRTKLGEALTGRQDVEYLGREAAPSDFQGKVSRKLFSSPETVKEGIGLIGYDKMRELAERYISNSLRNKNASAVGRWLDDNVGWLQQMPEIEQKALDYNLSVAQREAKAKELVEARERRDRWKKRLGYGAAGAAGLYGAKEYYSGNVGVMRGQGY